MQHDEHEMLIEYSEMTTFDFNSKEFQEVKKDYRDCETMAFNIVYFLSHMLKRFTQTKAY